MKYTETHDEAMGVICWSTYPEQPGRPTTKGDFSVFSAQEDTYTFGESAPQNAKVEERQPSP